MARWAARPLSYISRPVGRKGNVRSHLPAPAEASSQIMERATGFAQAGNRYPPRIKCGAGFFGVMR